MASASRTAGDVGAAALEGPPDLRGLLEQGGPMPDRPFDADRQRQLGGQLGHLRPLAAEQQRGHELVEVVHVGKVVEDEAQRDTGAQCDRLRRRVRLAGAQQLHEGLRHIATGSLAAGHPSVPGWLFECRQGRQVERCLFTEGGAGRAMAPCRTRPAGHCREASNHSVPLPVIGGIQRELETCEMCAHPSAGPSRPISA